MKNTAQALGHEPIRKLVVRMSTPSIIALLVHALYNVVDAIFVGRGVGTLGIAGIGVAFPTFLLMIGLGQLVSVGSASVLSRALGRGDMKTAEESMGTGICLVAVAGIALAIIGILFGTQLMKFSGATSEVLPYAVSYITIILGGSFPFLLSFALSGLVRAQGDALRATVPILVAALLNIALDPLFIFGFHMGTAGAAWATILAQGIGVSYLAWHILRGRSVVRFHLRNLRLRAHLVREIVSIGTSSFIRTFSSSAATVVINRVLGIHGGDVDIAVYSVVNRLMSFARMPIFGVVDGVQPIFGFNYGARQTDRVQSTIWHGLAFAGLLSGFFWIVFLVFPRAFLGLFSTDVALITRGSTALRWIALVIPLFAVQAIVGGLYQAIGRASHALVISLLRGIILIIPCVFILSHFFGTTGVWVAFSVTDVLSALIVLPMLLSELRRLRRLGIAYQAEAAGIAD
ncbi:MATE family efflux transporter [Candidatus Bipolaricaulota bacterium]|nr:MATE family efflux transporter [Candidatus Bipolaricaulota bacterium]TFH08655.1 MAG: MATE family efflux transporter [Candidatus Atribacteria bacterium]